MPVLDGIIRLYDVSGGGLPNPIYFVNQIEADGSNIEFDGNEYTAFPIQSTNGWERSLDGALPRPTIVISNIFSDISALIKDFGLRDANLIRRIIPIKNLDNGSDPDPSAVIRTESYFVSRLSWNNNIAIVNLRSPIDVENLKIPRRIIGSLIS